MKHDLGNDGEQTGVMSSFLKGILRCNVSSSLLFPEQLEGSGQAVKSECVVKGPRERASKVSSWNGFLVKTSVRRH